MGPGYIQGGTRPPPECPEGPFGAVLNSGNLWISGVLMHRAESLNAPEGHALAVPHEDPAAANHWVRPRLGVPPAAGLGVTGGTLKLRSIRFNEGLQLFRFRQGEQGLCADFQGLNVGRRVRRMAPVADIRLGKGEEASNQARLGLLTDCRTGIGPDETGLRPPRSHPYSGNAEG